MSEYAIADHLIRLEENASVLKVYQLTELESINLENDTAKVEVVNENYQVDVVPPVSYFEQDIDEGYANTFRFVNKGFIGSADLRDTKVTQFNYFLNNCPVYLRRAPVQLIIGSPCADPCAAPNTGCRSLKKLP